MIVIAKCRRFVPGSRRVVPDFFFRTAPIFQGMNGIGTKLPRKLIGPAGDATLHLKQFIFWESVRVHGVRPE